MTATLRLIDRVKLAGRTLFGYTPKPQDFGFRPIFGGWGTLSGTLINETNALKLSAFYACINVISQSCAVLPLKLYRRGKENARDTANYHPVYYLLHDQPNRYQSSLDFRQTVTGHLVTRGNAYAEIIPTRGGEPSELFPLEPEQVRIKASGWDLYYEVQNTNHQWVSIPRDRILHLRAWSRNGLIGRDPIECMKETLGEGVATQTHTAKYFANGAKPGLVITHPEVLDADQQKTLRESIDAIYAGPSNAYRTLVLEEGAKAETLAANNAEAQLLELRNFLRTEICAFFRVPPHLIGDLSHATYSNIEQQSMEFIRDCLLYWLTNWEQRAAMDLLTRKEREEFYFEHTLDNFARGDLEARIRAYAQAVTNGLMSRSEVRERENLPPYPGSDRFIIPKNMDATGGNNAPAPN